MKSRLQQRGRAHGKETAKGSAQIYLNQYK